MNWTEQQSNALKAVEEWFYSKDRKQIFRVFGYAGVGKTSLAKSFAETIDGDVLFAAFTGKAALVLRKNGCRGATTLHSLIYKAVEQEDGTVEFIHNDDSPLYGAELLIVDECSMVDEDLAKDILAFRKPVLVLGDPAQLPPIAGAGYFTNAEPDVMLTEIHRQAKDNPIVYLATRVRRGLSLELGDYDECKIVSKIASSALAEHEQVIVGKNDTRQQLNRRIRKMMNFEDELPYKGDRIICLRNDKLKGIYNGGMFNVVKRIPNNRYPEWPTYQVNDIDNPQNRGLIVKVHDSFFTGDKKPDWKYLKGTQEFDFGYAITCHKSQGSQWDNILVFDESYCFREDSNRWLYTAITRAQNRLTVYKK